MDPGAAYYAFGLVLLVALLLFGGPLARRSARKRLGVFARGLDQRAELRREGGRCSVTGRMGGRDFLLEATAPRRTWEPWSFRLTTPVEHAVTMFQLSAKPRLSGSTRLEDRFDGELPDDSGLGRALREHLLRIAADEVVLANGVLSVRWRGGVNEGTLWRVTESLLDLARACGRVKVALKQALPVKVEPLGWGEGGGEILCPYCRDSLDPDGPDRAACASCGTLHHAECLSEAGRCTVIGCRAPLPGRARA